jgi:hypothetical protein
MSISVKSRMHVIAIEPRTGNGVIGSALYTNELESPITVAHDLDSVGG